MLPARWVEHVATCQAFPQGFSIVGQKFDQYQTFVQFLLSSKVFQYVPTGRSNDDNIFTKHSVRSKCRDHYICTQHVTPSPKSNSKNGRIFIGVCGRGLLMGKLSYHYFFSCVGIIWRRLVKSSEWKLSVRVRCWLTWRTHSRESSS